MSADASEGEPCSAASGAVGDTESRLRVECAVGAGEGGPTASVEQWENNGCVGLIGSPSNAFASLPTVLLFRSLAASEDLRSPTRRAGEGIAANSGPVSAYICVQSNSSSFCWPPCPVVFATLSLAISLASSLSDGPLSLQDSTAEV
jgi:hypothetical protein